MEIRRPSSLRFPRAQTGVRRFGKTQNGKWRSCERLVSTEPASTGTGGDTRVFVSSGRTKGRVREDTIWPGPDVANDVEDISRNPPRAC